MEKGAILPLFYLPPIQFFSTLISYKNNVVIDRFEHFPKQTFRNRANIYSPNGKLSLIVPVIKGSKTHTKVKDVKISYDFNWQRAHWLSLQTSYRSAAYFEFYEDDFAPFYQKKWEFLFDFNEALLTLLLGRLKLSISYSYTEAFEENYPQMADYRQNIHPKQTAGYIVKNYFQVFEQRNGFLNNLSIIDLLFNQGPQSINYL